MIGEELNYLMTYTTEILDELNEWYAKCIQTTKFCNSVARL